MLRSHYISELTKEMDGKSVTVAGWVHEVRETAKITFMLVRDRTGIVQVIGKQGVADAGLIKKMSMPKESVVLVKGRISSNPEAKKGFEIIPEQIENLNPLGTSIPFEVTGKVPADLDVRLDYRYIDLRRLSTKAIFNIESTILATFSSMFSKKGFTQIRTPSIIAEASEGGAELFQVKYFEKDAYMAQSPQLYKQLAVIGGLDKVYMIAPVFRAEKSNTTYHLTESTQMDIEMGFADDSDAIKELAGAVTTMIKAVKKNNKEDLETLGVELDVPKVKVVTYSKVIDKLRSNGYAIEFGSDISREYEAGIQKVFGDAVIVREFPTALRAFYSMPKEDNPELSKSYDFIYKGLEISSGAQRIHKADMLVEALRKRNLDPSKFEFYVNAFRCGAPPHAGWSIGMERLAMRITNSSNIRECSLFPRDRKRITP
ncbi:MAG: aspartate--tRNA(Asn) ligase [Candidatus Marsarchaeota archaeon]|nr:aspartate--tRNA(Asn) ligase [Candidatus Marsarchaeota archaeon]MCL5418884.1 aspartate--tRNA(Asn) ligase [Candidatus Marsarchaeota archaeon]